MKKIFFVILAVFLALCSETLRPYCIWSLVLFGVWYFLMWYAKRGGDTVPSLHCYLFSGSMGSGKSYLSVERAVALYAKRNFQFSVYRIFFWLEKLPFKPCKTLFPEEWKHPCKVFSTYPICLKWKKLKRAERKKRKKEYTAAIQELKVHLQNEDLTDAERQEAVHAIKWLTQTMEREPVLSEPLLVEHLLMEKKLPENAVIVIGEAGRILAQWEFSNPLVVEQIATFVALSRQFCNATIILDDQCSDNVVKAVRCRLGMIYHLHNFHRLWGIFPYYKVYYTELLPVEDTTMTTKEVEGETYFIGKLPYSWTPYVKRYESRMYKELYYQTAQETTEAFFSFYTRYLPHIAVDDSLCKFYQSHKRAYKRNFMYNPDVTFDVDKGKFVPKKERGEGAEGEG